MKKKQPTSYRCCEGTGYFAENCTREEAFELISADHPDGEDEDFQYTAEDLKEVTMRPCKDCGSSWTGDDICGECGEDRLSKRSYRAWYLET